MSRKIPGDWRLVQSGRAPCPLTAPWPGWKAHVCSRISLGARGSRSVALAVPGLGARQEQPDELLDVFLGSYLLHFVLTFSYEHNVFMRDK